MKARKSNGKARHRLSFRQVYGLGGKYKSSCAILLAFSMISLTKVILDGYFSFFCFFICPIFWKQVFYYDVLGLSIKLSVVSN